MARRSLTSHALDVLLLAAYRRALRARLRRRPGAPPLERALRGLVARTRQPRVRQAAGMNTRPHDHDDRPGTVYVIDVRRTTDGYHASVREVADGHALDVRILPSMVAGDRGAATAPAAILAAVIAARIPATVPAGARSNGA